MAAWRFCGPVAVCICDVRTGSVSPCAAAVRPGTWIADLYHDGEAGALTLTTQPVSAGAKLPVAVTRDGGFVLRLRPA